MSLLDSLKSILHIDINLSGLKELHFFSDNQNKQVFNIDNRRITINFGAIKAEDIPKIQEVIKKAVQQDDELLIESKASTLLDDIYKFNASGEDEELYSFFIGKLSATDLEILRASLYVKSVYKRGQHVGLLKHDITIKYGERGRNIVNLCTAGYFSSIIKPLYEQMVQQPNFTPTMFLASFDLIVEQSPFAIFVNSHVTQDLLLKEVQTKMTLNKRYGISYLNIHGIGENNVQKIEEVLIALKDKFTHTPDIESGRGYITVTIYF